MRIAVVEDDPFIRRIASLALERIGGFEVVTMNDGAEFLERWRGECPDVVLLDVMMPRVDGPTALRRLREDPEGESLPVIFSTARAQPSEIEEYEALGVCGVIVKPFDPLLLSDQVREMLEGFND